MATFHFELVSPEKLMFSGEVTQVDVPGEEGDFGVLAGHAPFVTTLRPGVLTVYGGEHAPTLAVVRGGFAEIGPNGLTVLAQEVVPVDEIQAETIEQAMQDVREDIADAKDFRTKDKASERLAQLQLLKDAVVR